MFTLRKALVYVTRDIERALGRAPGANYFVVSNDTPYGREVAAKYPESVLLVPNSGETFDTFDLLKHPLVDEAIEKHDADVLVFQNNPRIERLCAEKGWRLLNPSATLARTVEEKVSQVAWLGEDAELLPPHRLNTVGKVDFAKASTAKGGTGKFVLQFNHSHTGEGTFVIESAEQLAALAAKFPDRECRAVKFIQGPVFTMNVVASSLRIVEGSISYQITGLGPFTDLPFSTIGNDWALPYSPTLSDADRAAISRIAQRVGRRMRRSGWRGLFGIDVIKDEKTGEVFLLEINARQPASTTYESTLAAKQDPKRMTAFDAHLASLLAEGLNVYTRALVFCPVARVRTGSQIVQRVTTEPKRVDIAALRAKGLAVIAYDNAGHNKDLFRIQSESGIMSAHNALNEAGEAIRACIS